MGGGMYPACVGGWPLIYVTTAHVTTLNVLNSFVKRREPTAARKFPYSPYYPTRYRFNVRREEEEEVGQRRTRWRIHEYEAVGWPTLVAWYSRV